MNYRLLKLMGEDVEIDLILREVLVVGIVWNFGMEEDSSQMKLEIC